MPSQSQGARNAGGNRSRSLALQRWGLLIGGGALALYAARHRSKSGIALGGLLAYGATKMHPRTGEFHAQASFAINCTPEEAYMFWHNFENLPRFMRHVESVRLLSDGRLEWTAIGPMGTRVHWKAEITEDLQNRRIAWRSVPGSDFHNRGYVEFRPAPGNRGTIVTASIEYEPPAGALGRAAAAIFGKDPEFAIREDLRRFKQLIEAGEIPTIEGQSHGPRSTLISTIHEFYPERRKPSEFEVSRQFAAQRRAS
jgi:uncharacterized membrane protein